ncbi:porin [Acidovorax sp. NCPPB 2350]|nr:porin [Acidovorax sp. NCPPB 2350]
MRTTFTAAAASAMALATLSPDAHAQSSITLFGVVDLSMRQTNASDGSRVRTLSSGGLTGSRFGIRGMEDLGGDLSAGFWFEADVSADTGAANASSYWSRRSTLSLTSSDWGELRIGRDYVPLFTKQYVPFSAFGPNGVASNGNLFFGSQSLLGSGSGAGVRADNMIKYILPRGLGDFYGEVMGSFAEGRDVNRHRGSVLGHASGPFDINVGFGRTSDTNGLHWIRLSSIGASYNPGWARFSMLFQHARYLERNQQTMDLSASVPVGNSVLKISYIRADQSGAGTDVNDANQVSLGCVHYLSKRTALYGTFSRIGNKGTQNFGLGGVTPPAGGSVRGIEFGMNHTF